MTHLKHTSRRHLRKLPTLPPAVRRSHKVLRPINELAALTALATLGRKFLNVSLF